MAFSAGKKVSRYAENRSIPFFASIYEGDPDPLYYYLLMFHKSREKCENSSYIRNNIDLVHDVMLNNIQTKRSDWSRHIPEFR